jgi:hypothetical protein
MLLVRFGDSLPFFKCVLNAHPVMLCCVCVHFHVYAQLGLEWYLSGA